MQERGTLHHFVESETHDGTDSASLQTFFANALVSNDFSHTFVIRHFWVDVFAGPIIFAHDHATIFKPPQKINTICHAGLGVDNGLL
ncbi:hypothetical protein B2L_1751 [Bifidobacterium breve 2L]|nr:hypothetical protein B2258_1138 [Bifidobacterium breve NCFB 2258]AHJ23198.1 hypothetical protein B689b_1190 [Bifidobacterium breve 689b]AUD71107.1 hypothetical protein NRBB04_1139 [Bifidobacterium breve]EWH39712.1 hypothetical protein B2L_1751 [Bifidobacterium breve 2L]AUD93592.1 hypothetical protein DRBB28_1407 [Bifidobacterium breve]